ncbi:MAG: DUF547 domain-containing protein [Myxococcota bacterium]
MHPALTQLQGFLDAYGYLVVFAVGLAEFGGVPIASTPILLALGAFVATGTLNPVATVTAAALGGLVGDSLWYGLARWRGHRLVDLACGLATNPGGCVLKVKDRILRTGPLFLIPAKFLPAASNLTAAASGLSGLSARRFFAYDGTALVLWAGVHIALGAAFSSQIAVVLDWMVRFLDWVVGLAAALVLLAFVWRWAKIRMHARVHRAMEAGSPPEPNAAARAARRGVLPGVVVLSVAIAVGTAFALSGGGSDSEAPAGAGDCQPFDHQHASWARVLRDHVDAGKVDYRQLARTEAPHLQAYLRSLRSVCEADYRGWSRPQKLAFWINAYNAYTVRLILDHYPLDSIRDIGVVPGAAFRKRFIELPWHPRKELSLDDIEHRIIRARFREPRIHFALVCAARGCPELRSEPYLAQSLDRQLDDAARRFIRDPTKNRFDADTRTLHLSPIFDWFRDDFEKRGTTVADFVAEHADREMAKAIEAGNLGTEFLDYDWSLNQP